MMVPNLRSTISPELTWKKADVLLLYFLLRHVWHSLLSMRSHSEAESKMTCISCYLLPM